MAWISRRFDRAPRESHVRARLTPGRPLARTDSQSAAEKRIQEAERHFKDRYDTLRRLYEDRLRALNAKVREWRRRCYRRACAARTRPHGRRVAAQVNLLAETMGRDEAIVALTAEPSTMKFANVRVQRRRAARSVTIARLAQARALELASSALHSERERRIQMLSEELARTTADLNSASG